MRITLDGPGEIRPLLSERPGETGQARPRRKAARTETAVYEENAGGRARPPARLDRPRPRRRGHWGRPATSNRAPAAAKEHGLRAGRRQHRFGGDARELLHREGRVRQQSAGVPAAPAASVPSRRSDMPCAPASQAPTSIAAQSWTTPPNGAATGPRAASGAGYQESDVARRPARTTRRRPVAPVEVGRSTAARRRSASCSAARRARRPQAPRRERPARAGTPRTASSSRRSPARVRRLSSRPARAPAGEDELALGGRRASGSASPSSSSSSIAPPREQDRALGLAGGRGSPAAAPARGRAPGSWWRIACSSRCSAGPGSMPSSPTSVAARHGTPRAHPPGGRRDTARASAERGAARGAGAHGRATRARPPRRVSPAGEVGLEPRLERRGRSSSSRSIAGARTARRRSRRGGPVPERERLAEGRSRGSAGSRDRRGPRPPAARTGRDRARPGRPRMSTRADVSRRAEPSLAQVRDVELDRVAAVAGGRPPEQIDEPVRRHHLVRVVRNKARRARCSPRPAARLFAVEDLERPEDPELHPIRRDGTTRAGRAAAAEPGSARRRHLGDDVSTTRDRRPSRPRARARPVPAPPSIPAPG